MDSWSFGANDNISIVPTGMDVGSRCVRVATGQAMSMETLMEQALASWNEGNPSSSTFLSGHHMSNDFTDATNSSNSSNEGNYVDFRPKVVVNADGQRWTRAAVATSSNYDGDNINNSTADQQDFVWGDAAAAAIDTNTTTTGGWVRDLLCETEGRFLRQQQELLVDDNDYNNNTKHQGDATTAFFGHVLSSHIPQFQVACDSNNNNNKTSTGTSATPTNTCWAVVVSVPPSFRGSGSGSTDNDESDEGDANDGDFYIPAITRSIQLALNKSKRRQRRKLPYSSSVIGIISDPVAAAMAYSFYESILSDNNVSSSNNNGAASVQRNLLVIDGGASGCTWTWLEMSPSPMMMASQSWAASSSSQPRWLSSHHTHLWSMKHTVTDPMLSTQVLTETIARYVAEQLEQQHRLPRGSTIQHQRAWFKLRQACEQQILSRLLLSGGSSSTNIHRNWAVHLDGWYQGLDCHITISAPRLDLLLNPIQQKVKSAVFGALEYIATNLHHHSQNELTTTTTVLLAGSFHAWLKPIVESVITQWNASTTTSTLFQLAAISPQQLPPEEMVTIGCTLQAQWILSKSPASIFRGSTTLMMSSPSPPPLVLEPCIRVIQSPITIGISSSSSTGGDIETAAADNQHLDDSERMKILIERHVTLLPCSVSYPLSNEKCLIGNNKNNGSSPSVTWTLWQLRNDAADNITSIPTPKKALAHIQLPCGTSNENGNILSLYLSERGQLQASMTGTEDVVTLSPYHHYMSSNTTEDGMTNGIINNHNDDDHDLD